MSAALRLLLAAGLSFAQQVEAAHPLSTEDAYTLGEGVAQLEVGLERAHFDNPTVQGRTLEVRPVLSYGLLDNLDALLGTPYLDTRELSAAGIERTHGVADASFELKWRFWENDLVKVALKPGLTVPTGNFRSGLGSGDVDPSIYLVSTFEQGDWIWNIHVGYLRNDNRVDERRDIFHMSGSVVYRFGPQLQGAIDIAADSSADRGSGSHPAVALAALIYSPTEHVDLDLGAKVGLNGLADVYALLAGATVRWQ